jgi:hypothetical protein
MSLFNKTIDIHWMTNPGNLRDDSIPTKSYGWQNVLYFEPEPLIKHLASSRIKTTEYLKCPAWQDHYKNTFVIKCPIDITISFDKFEDGKYYTKTDRLDQNFYNTYIMDRGESIDQNKVLSIIFSYMFYSKDSVILEQLNASMERTSLALNTRCIEGEFDISKWIRPVNFSFEVIDINKPLVFKRGDPLFYLKFRTDKKINFIRKDWSEEISYVTNSLTNIKQFMTNNSMKTNYTLAEPFIKFNKDKLFGKEKKCPFGFGKK